VETDVEEFRYTAYQIMGNLPQADRIKKFIDGRREKDKNELYEILIEYLNQDSVPRVKKAVKSILDKYNFNNIDVSICW
jgi:tetrahydromethanopterin S-methyltransferase subunit F